MRYVEFVSKFKAQVVNAPPDKKILLAISICKKLFFDYQIFAKENNWGNPDLLLDAIKLAEGFQPEDEKKVQYFLSQIDDNCPDSEDFGNASYAINASSAVYETLQFLIDQNSEHIYNIGISLTDTVDFKIQEDEELTDEQIDSHPLMIEARYYLIESSR
ncbi:DUF416 family protein [Candidatus Parcubacteria bacterium]|nr:DUF416 family protein [Candidatus Parcubacteria bacterium]